MHPYSHWHGAHWHWHRGPSRLIWFFIGAAAATFWHKHKEAKHGVGWHPHCLRAPIQPPVLSSSANPDRRSMHGVSKAINNIPPAELSNSTEWNEEKQRMAELSRSAGDKLAELSEATLDTVLTTVEVLKAKLAEHRAERDKQLQDERRKNPPRPV
ncbi:hypothetical protein LshimejAT787_1004840 [Lyophyllum shimeji]|uniref:Uncharacterized protein n=1 Tax=Lyophyllum shimeji TaxID=47721 RepID=A0A9P3PUP0_LYOSH|nr:hypothetical protein LshimejAT787_1004840 [Lyophyllum shimeji]